MRWIMLIATILISAGTLYLIVTGTLFPIDTEALKRYPASIDYFWIAAAVLAFTVNYPGNSWRFSFISKNVGIAPVPFLPSLSIVWSSSFLTTFLPSSIAMDIGRIALLGQLGYVGTAGATRIVVVDRASGLFAFVLLGVLTLPWLLSWSSAPVGLAWIWLFSALTVVAALVVCKLPVVRWLPSKLVTRLWSLVEDFDRLFFRIPNVLKMMAVGVLNAFSFAVVLWLLGFAIGAPIEFMPLVLAAPVLIVINNLPFFYQGFGGRELAMVVLVEPMTSVDATQMTMISVLAGAVVWTTALLGASFFPALVAEHVKKRAAVDK